MRIGIVGSGNIGGTCATLLARAGHEVVLSNRRGPESIADQAAALGAGGRAAPVEEAARAGELVIVAIPLRAVAELPAEAFAGRVVVDAMNYYPDRDGRFPEIDSGALTSSEVVARHLVGAQIVKAFNTIWYQRLLTEGRPAGDPARLALPIAGDDAAAKAVVGELIDEMGFDAVDAGSLAESARQEPGATVYNAPLTAEEVRAALASSG